MPSTALVRSVATTPVTSPLATIEIVGSRRSGSLAGVGALALAGLTYLCLRRGWLIDIPALSRAAARNGGVTPQGFALALTTMTALGLSAVGITHIARAWLQQRAAVVVLTSEGLLDPRVTPQLIPWTAIQSITEWQWEGRRGIVLTVEPAIFETLDLAADLKEGRSIGLKAVPVRTRDLAIRYSRMLTLLRSYHAQYGRAEARETTT